jgi:hypothetical protein
MKKILLLLNNIVPVKTLTGIPVLAILRSTLRMTGRSIPVCSSTQSVRTRSIMVSMGVLLCFAVQLTTLTSCDDFLTRAPLSNMNELDFYNSEEDMKLAIVAVYATLHDVYHPGGIMSYFGELMSDNVESDCPINIGSEGPSGTTSDAISRTAFANGAVLPDNALVKVYWDTFYAAIFRINNVISRIPEFNNANQYEAEMRFLRALYYFNMVQAWGRVALVTKPLTLEEAYSTGLADPDAVYAQIIEDLTFAANNLPESPRLIGTATSGAANTLLGKVYLTQGNKADAAATLQKVYGKYSLVDYADLWDLGKKNNAESIFEIQFAGGASNPYSRYFPWFAPYENRGAVSGWGYGNNKPTDQLWNAYEPNDIRRDISINNGYDKEENDGSITHVDTRYPNKWIDSDADRNSNNVEYASNNFIVLRYADVLLMLAEATGEARYLNEVRTRAGLTDYGTTGYPTQYNTLELAIEHERQVEFAMEFHRMFDLKRTGRALTVLNGLWTGTLDQNHLVLPIPLSVIDQNPIVVKQNTGY